MYLLSFSPVLYLLIILVLTAYHIHRPNSNPPVRIPDSLYAGIWFYSYTASGARWQMYIPILRANAHFYVVKRSLGRSKIEFYYVPN